MITQKDKFRTVSPKLEIKRINKVNTPAFSLLRTIMSSNNKKLQTEIYKTNSLQFSSNLFKRPESHSIVQDNLKIVGHSHQYYKYFNSQIKPKTSIIIHRKISTNISRNTVKSKNQFYSMPKQSIKVIHKQGEMFDKSLQKNSAKLEIIYKQKQLKLKSNILILNVQFIFQQTKFWKQDEIQQDVLKNWRKLQSTTTIIWIIQKQKSFKKLQIFALKNQLQLDTVCLVRKPKKKKVITLSLKHLQFELNLKGLQKIFYIDTLITNHYVSSNFQCYQTKFPLIYTKNATIHFLECDYPKLAFTSIFNIIKKQSDIFLNVEPIFTSYQSYLSKYRNNKLSIIQSKHLFNQFQQSDDFDDESKLQARIEQTKGTWIKDIINRSKSLCKQREVQKDSIQYTIGDLLKRNYCIMKQIMNQSKKHKQEKLIQQNTELDYTFSLGKYNLLIYLWKF